ncbi:hypothetical protein [Marinobacter sp. P4B1]|uniref:hypothetical protein n=1 Tax=Marinobacter sp. P4B1 TaxID=1119533 RepID=UPI00071DAE0B|nr:hypothetical protein [Marinobacter sp. P4B1]KRW83664.1 hypothetical protein AQ621_16580 [Marinobacter sp. P4B1]
MALQATITEKQLKKAAKYLKRELNMPGRAGKPVTHAWLLESLCQGLYGKPYGELRAALFSGQHGAELDSGVNAASPVLLLSYGSETVLTLNGEYVCSQSPGSDMEIPLSALSAQAASLASQHGCTASQVELPELLGDEWEIDDILELAGKLGYFRYKKPFVHLLSGTPVTVIYGGVAQVESLDGDHMDAIRCDIDSGEPWRDVFERKLVWSPDFSKGFTNCELFFSYEELGRAEEIRPNVWRVTARHAGQTFEYDFEVIVRH